MTATPRLRRHRPMLATAVVLAVLAVPLVTAGASFAAGDTTERALSAQVTVDIKDTPFPCNCGPGGAPVTLQSCQFVVFVQFPTVPYADSYNVVVQDKDPRVNATRKFTGPPFNDVGPAWSDAPGQFKAPAGSHRFGPLTGGGGSEPACTDSVPGLMARFDIKKAVAVLPLFCKGIQGAKSTGRAAAAAGPICPTLPVKPAEVIENAKEQRRIWSDAAVYNQGLTVASSLFAGGTAMVPGGQVVSGVLLLETAVFGGYSVYAQYMANEWAKIEEDPPDKNWRKIAAPLATAPGKLDVPSKMSDKQEKQVRALYANLTRTIALSDCVSKSIDRGTTALPRSGAIARLQYRAGAACAAESAKLGEALPRLAAPIVASLRPYDDQIVSAAKSAPRDARYRNAVAKTIAQLGRTTGVPDAQLKALQKTLLDPTTAPPSIGPSVGLEQLAAAAKAQAPVMRTAGKELAAAAKGS